MKTNIVKLTPVPPCPVVIPLLCLSYGYLSLLVELDIIKKKKKFMSLSLQCMSEGEFQ